MDNFREIERRLDADDFERASVIEALLFLVAAAVLVVFLVAM